MKHIKYIAVIVAFLLTSCFEDKGNYDYIEIKDATVNVPEVEDNKGQISRDRYDDLQLNPEIQFNAGSSSADFNFEWSIYPQQVKKDEDGNYPPKKVIGDKQTVDYNLTDAPGKYYVVLKVTNKETKSCTDYRFALTINSVSGWLVYDENTAGEGDLQIIRDNEIVPGLPVVQNGVVRNYFSTSNGGQKLHGGTFLARRNMNNAYDHLFVFKADGVTKLSASTYEVVTEDYAMMFQAAPKVNAPMALYYPNPVYGYMEVLVNNNEMHVIKWNVMMQVDKFPGALNAFGTAFKANAFIAPIPPVSANTNRAVLYNDISNKKGQFIAINSNGTAVYPSVNSVFNTQAINPDETTELKLTYLGQGRDGISCAVFRDKKANEKPWLYVADFRLTATPLALAKHDLSNLENISDAKIFAFGTRGDVMFYATSTQVYSYAFGTGTATNILSKGEEIVSMKLYTHSGNDDYSGRVLYVATYDGAAGKVYKVKFNELNGQPEGEVVEYTGFGRVVDMIVKE